MAKKDEFDFGTEDLDAFDFDWGDDYGDDFSSKKKDRKPSEDFISEAKRGTLNAAKGRLVNAGVIRRLLSLALPKGYSQAFNAYDGIKGGIGNIYKDNQAELDPVLRKAKLRMDRAGPLAKRLMPKDLREALEAAERSGESYSANPNAELDSNVAGIDQLLAMQSKKQLEDNIQGATAEIRQRKQFALEMTALAEVGRGIGRLVGYQDTVTINFHRKSLEIGYRQLDVAVKTMRAQATFHADARALLDAVRHNTALPDFVKMRSMEVVKQQLANRLASSMAMSAGGWASTYFSNIRKNASNFVGGALGAIGAADGLSGDAGMSRAGMAGSAAGEFAGEALGGIGEFLLESLANNANPYLSKVPGLQKGGNWLRKNLNGIPQRLNEYAKSDPTRGGITGWLEEKFKALLDRHSPTASIAGKQIQDLDQPAQFDLLFHRSVTEIMPGYLASIDRTLRSMYTGEDQEENAYSHYSGGFVTRSTLNEQHVRIALKGGDRGGLRSQIDYLLRQMGADTLSDDAKRALRIQLMKDMSGAKDFKPDRYVQVNTWSKVPEEIAEELIEFFADTFGLDPSGRQVDQSQETTDKLADVREQFLDLTQRIPDYGSRMNILQDVVGRRSWRELGLSDYNGQTSDNINLDKVYDLLVNNVSEDNLAPLADPEKKRKFRLGSKEEMMEQLRESLEASNEKERRKKEAAEAANKFQYNDQVDTIGAARGPGSAAFRPAAAGPVEVNANVQFPDLMMTADEQTHERLEALIAAIGDSNSYLDMISQMTFGQGGGPQGNSTMGPDGPRPQNPFEDGFTGDTSDPPEPSRKKRRGVLGYAWGGIKMSGRGLRNYLKTSYSLMWKGTKLASRVGWGAAKLPFKPIEGLGGTDVYVEGDEKPVLTNRKIKNGEYFDVNTEKVISSVRDITGEVKDRDGNVVITQEDFEKGLSGKGGMSLARWGLGKGLSLSALALKGIGAYTSFTYGAMWKTAKWAVNKLTTDLRKVDAYFPGEDKPRIRSVLMDRNFYRDKDGAPINSIDDIKGSVYDIDGNEIISEEEMQKYKALYARNGSVIFRLGRGAWSLTKGAAELGWKAAKAYGRLTGKMYSGLWKATKAIVKFPFKLMGFGKKKQGGVGSTDEELNTGLFEVNIEQLTVQRNIYDLLKQQYDSEHVRGDFDGDGLKENSWWDIVKRRKGKGGAAGPAGGDDKVTDAIEKLGKGLEEKLDELIDTTEEAGEDSLLDKASQLDDLAGGGKEKRGRKPKVKKPGRFGRVGRWASKLGRGLKRIPGAGMITRGAAWAGSAALGAVEAAPVLGAVASGVGTAAAWAGSALLATGSAIVGALSIPIVAGAVVLGGAAYLGYRYYKSEKAKDFPLLYLRMTQYGVNPTDQARVEQVLQLEGMLKGSVTIDKTGKSSIDTGNLNMEAVYKLFGINSTQRVQQFATWIQNRFRPVFLAHSSVMNRLRGTTDLVSADTGIGTGDLDVYLSAVDIGGMESAYNDTGSSPFDGSLDTDADDVASAVKMARSRITADKQSKVEQTDSQLAAGNKEQAAKTAIVSVTAGGTSDVKSIEAGLNVARAGIDNGFGVEYVATTSSSSSMKSLDIPTAVRFVSYGLQEMTLERCLQLSKVEEVYWPKIRYSGTSKATIDGNLTDLEAQVMDIFKPGTDPEHEDVRRWLSYRFLPVILQYAISCRRRYNGFAQDAGGKLAGADMRDVLNETTAATADTMTGTVSIWKIQNSPWPGVVLETMPGAVKRFIDGLDTGDTSKVLSVDGIKAQANYAEANKQYGNQLTNTALGNARTERGSLGQTGSAFENYSKIYGKGAVAGGVKGQSTTGQADGSLLMANQSSGVAVTHPGGGAGGDINSVPIPKGDGWANVKDTIIAAAKMVGMDPAIMATVAGIESSYKIRAGAGTSSAKGLYQFIDSTWATMLQKYGAQYGISPMATQFDARANAILGACFLKENYEGLSKSLNGNVTDTDLYAAHFMGLGGARRLLSADRSAPASAAADPGAIDANKDIFKDKSGSLRSVGGVIAELNRRVGMARKMHDLSSGASTVTDPAVTDGTGAATGTPASSSGFATPGGNNEVAAGAEEDDPGATPSPTGPKLDTPASSPVMDGANKAAANAGVAAASTDAPPPMQMPTRMLEEDTEVPTQGYTAPTPTPPTATRQAVQTNQKKEAAAQADYQTNMSQLLQDQLTVAKSSDTTLSEIKALATQMVQNMQKGGTGGSTQPVAQPKPEPAIRNPVSTSRPRVVS